MRTAARVRFWPEADIYCVNCDDGSPEGTGPDGGTNGGLGNGGTPALTGGQLDLLRLSSGLLASF